MTRAIFLALVRHWPEGEPVPWLGCGAAIVCAVALAGLLWVGAQWGIGP